MRKFQQQMRNKDIQVVETQQRNGKKVRIVKMVKRPRVRLNTQQGQIRMSQDIGEAHSVSQVEVLPNSSLFMIQSESDGFGFGQSLSAQPSSR